MDIFQQIGDSLQNGDTDGVQTLVRSALDTGVKPLEILNSGLIPGMNRVGEKFRAHEIFLPDVLLAARAMHCGIDLLKPLMIKEGIPNLGKIVIGTVRGDLHDIGKNLVAILLKGAGFEIIDLGHDVPPEKFIKTAMSEKANIIGMSALLTTTMPVMKKVVDLARAEGIYGKVRIMIGGAPVTAEYARQIGADAYCFDGMKAVDTARQFVGQN